MNALSVTRRDSQTLDAAAWSNRIEALFELADPCQLCPHRCGAHRLHGERGRCLVGDRALLASACVHRGEEPVLGGTRGVGNLFFGGCTLRCVICQNHQISQTLRGQRIPARGPGIQCLRPGAEAIEARWAVDAEALHASMLDLLERGAPVIGLVSPTPHLPWVVQALARLQVGGRHVPILYNSSGYERVEVLALLDGVVDLYLPDLKHVTPRVAGRLCAAPDYPQHALAAIQVMHEQVGSLQLGDDGIARRGLLVRHLVLPGHVTESERVLRELAGRLGTEIGVSLLAQYHPRHHAQVLGPLARRLRRDEYRRVLRCLEDLGFEQGYTQDLEAPDSYLPDFERAQHPFEP
ncbi:MAG: radical SAM protein [Pseudomonadota bacterium]